MLGDSLTAGYGLAPADALPVQLERELRGRGHEVDVANAGVSGDTTAHGLRRLDRDVPPDAQLCIVALGANDMMQMVAPDRIAANLDAILGKLRAMAIPALLTGMRAPPWFGPYASAFDRLFADAARRQGVAFDPFLLEGVALNPLYTLADRIHPNALAVQRIARRMAPVVVELLPATKPSDPVDIV